MGVTADPDLVSHRTVATQSGYLSLLQVNILWELDTEVCLVYHRVQLETQATECCMHQLIHNTGRQTLHTEAVAAHTGDRTRGASKTTAGAHSSTIYCFAVCVDRQHVVSWTLSCIAAAAATAAAVHTVNNACMHLSWVHIKNNTSYEYYTSKYETCKT